VGALDGRVAIITGAGRGLGREHALLFAREGAKVVVNDLGGDGHGTGADVNHAQQVVDEIRAFGGEAVANVESVCDWNAAKAMIDQAIDVFGDLHVLVNNAGILRDRLVFNLSEEDWDSVMDVHLKGHFCPTHHAAAYWRQQTKAGTEVRASVIHTSSTSGVLGNAGQSNYGAAKAGIAAFSSICASELSRYGVRSNAITPSARTRLTMGSPGVSDAMAEPSDSSLFDRFAPANVSPFVAYLATEDCTITGEAFHVAGDFVARYQPYVFMEQIKNGDRQWTVEGLAQAAPALLPVDRRGGPSEFQRYGLY
jgi:NAD(P)-dependent dehydrogenase (short-subunit alcohol dehydrogenase family)